MPATVPDLTTFCSAAKARLGDSRKILPQGICPTVATPKRRPSAVRRLMFIESWKFALEMLDDALEARNPDGFVANPEPGMSTQPTSTDWRWNRPGTTNSLVATVRNSIAVCLNDERNGHVAVRGALSCRRQASRSGACAPLRRRRPTQYDRFGQTFHGAASPTWRMSSRCPTISSMPGHGGCERVQGEEPVEVSRRSSRLRNAEPVWAELWSGR